MIELHQKRNLVRVLSRDGTEHAQRAGNGIASAFDCELDDVLGIEIKRVRSERCARGMLDALIDRQNRHIACSGEPSCT